MMQVAGGPPGEWSTLIVGHQWPSDMTISGLNAWIENRGQIANAHDDLADLLNAAKTGPLAVQQGKTADALLQMFGDGEQLARDIARKNGIKKDSYSSALSSVHSLREKLTGIAERYNQEIKKIIQSDEPVAVKMPRIIEAITQGQQEANLAAANCGGDIGDAGQRILDQETTGQSFRQFAGSNGIDMNQLFRSRDAKGLQSAVAGMLGSQNLPESGAAGGALAGANPAVSSLSGGGVPKGAAAGVNPSIAGTQSGGAALGANPVASGLQGGNVACVSSAGNLPAGSPISPSGNPLTASVSNPSAPGASIRSAGYTTTPPGLSPPGTPPPPTTTQAQSTIGVGTASSSLQPVQTTAGPVGGGALASPQNPSPPVAGPVGSGGSSNSFSAPQVAHGTLSPASALTPPSMLNPANVGITPSPASGGLNPAALQGSIAPPTMTPPDFSRHMDAGLMSQGAGAAPPTAPMAPQAPPTSMSPTTAPTAGSGDWHSSIPAAQSSAAQAAAPSYSAPAASPAVNTSAPSNSGYMTSAPSVSAPSTSYSGGALPAYGSDLRPPTISAPAGSPTPPPAMTSPPPLSASPSTTPAAGSGGGGLGQAAVARPESAPLMSQQPAPMGIAGKAVAASAVGAVAGAISADATARIRLQRIVDAVARQEPRLAWAIGDRPDDTTVLVTDLADGWIPPGIEIPSVVTLLEPERRRGDLESLLGEVKLAVNHTPDRYVPEADEPVPTSPRPRWAPEIEELGWELSSATHWRDGLPRLAHTLAKAASSGTGVDPSEIELLQQQMQDIGERVLDAYPAEVDSKDVGNWQLLAAIDALIRGDRAGANYHLAWFQASMANATAQQ